MREECCWIYFVRFQCRNIVQNKRGLLLFDRRHLHYVLYIIGIKSSFHYRPALSVGLTMEKFKHDSQILIPVTCLSHYVFYVKRTSISVII